MTLLHGYVAALGLAAMSHKGDRPVAIPHLPHTYIRDVLQLGPVGGLKVGDSGELEESCCQQDAETKMPQQSSL